MAGDVIGATSTEEERDQWAKFRDWAIELEARGITLVWIAGNHEFVLQSHPHFAKRFPGIYLCDSGVTINGVNFWGSPWQPWFHDWAFNAPRVDPGEEFLESKFSQIPANTDVLITHSPPAGFHDVVGGRHTGSLALNKHVQRVMPTLNVFGHIHHGYGMTHVETCTLANVSHTAVRGGRYITENSPVVFDLEIANTPLAA
jgi:Icc-related predicted phosphoesterase